LYDYDTKSGKRGVWNSQEHVSRLFYVVTEKSERTGKKEKEEEEKNHRKIRTEISLICVSFEAPL